MKIKNLKIGTQLIIAFSIIILVVITLGVVVRLQAERMANQTTDLFNHPFTVRRALGELKANVLSIHRSLKDMELSMSKDELEKNLQDIEKNKTSAFKQLDVLKERYLGPQSDIESAYNNFMEWNILFQETIMDIKQGQVKEAMIRTKSNGVGGQKVDEILANIQIIDNFALNKANQFYDNTIKLSITLKYQLIGLIIIVIAIVISIIIYFDRNIRNPIVELANVNKLFGEGDMNIRSKYISTNELGQLSSSFNTMAEVIQSEIDLNNLAANISEVMLSEIDAHRFSHSLLVSLLENTEAQAGALYLRNDAKTEYELFEGVGLNNEWNRSFSATNFDGEFGLALSTKKIQYLTQIPSNAQFLFYTSTGKFIPSEIITIPIVLGNEIVAVISLSSVKSFPKNSLTLLESVLTTISARMGGVLTFERMSEFSKQLELQNKRLEAQKEELHLLNRELAHKSETLAAANSELEQQRRELTEQSRELKEQNIELEVQKKQLDESNRLKTIFLSNMSHELRTPLNSVIALSGVLNRRLENQIPGEELSYLKIIERNGKQLLELINNILDLSRIESGREETEINVFNPKDLIAEIVESINPQAIQKNIRLSFKSETKLNPIKSDFVKCRHILQNIVANAVKFTDKGGVELSAEESNDILKISVTDTGIGIDEAYLSTIFDEFRQGDGSSSRKYGGTGLGLAIAKKYAELLGGKIEVKSKLHEGSVFTLVLPMQYDLSPEKIQPYVVETSLNKNSPQGDPASKYILLVEDSDAIIIQLKEILSREGYHILVAHNGQEAMQVIGNQVPDAMILDLMMPEIDGFEVLRRIREQERTDKLPVIILTAKYITKAELAFLKHNGIHQIIQKGDINKEQLLNAVARMMFPQKDTAPEQNTKPLAKTSSGHSILIVEDNPDNMVTIKALLGNKYPVIEAIDGLSGVEMAKAHTPGLILMDIALPGINGIEALREIKKEECLQSIPIIAVSASAMKGDKEDFIALGFDGYISKPIDNELFINTISEFMG